MANCFSKKNPLYYGGPFIFLSSANCVSGAPKRKLVSMVQGDEPYDHFSTTAVIRNVATAPEPSSMLRGLLMLVGLMRKTRQESLR